MVVGACSGLDFGEVFFRWWPRRIESDSPSIFQGIFSYALPTIAFADLFCVLGLCIFLPIAFGNLPSGARILRQSSL